MNALEIIWQRSYRQEWDRLFDALTAEQQVEVLACPEGRGLAFDLSQAAWKFADQKTEEVAL